MIINSFVWDVFNIQHIAKHSVAPSEVEEILDHMIIVVKSYKGRFLIFGTTHTGRMLAVAVERQDNDMYRPVSARDMSHKEILFFNKEREVL